jgi:hypothetical protein
VEASVQDHVKRCLWWRGGTPWQSLWWNKTAHSWPGSKLPSRTCLLWPRDLSLGPASIRDPTLGPSIKTPKSLGDAHPHHSVRFGWTLDSPPTWFHPPSQTHTLFSQYKWTELLLCVRHYFRIWTEAVDKMNKNPYCHGVGLSSKTNRQWTHN